MKKRLLSLLLCALMVTGLLPGTAFAEVAIDPVTYGYVRPDWDDTSDRYVNSTNKGVRTELSRAKGDNYSLQFASMQNGTVTILAPTNVTFTPDGETAPGAVTVEDETNVAVGTMPVFLVCMEDFGSGKLNVTLENGSFEVPVTVELPDYGFYTAPTPSEAAFVSGDFIFNGTNSLYLLPYGENVTITNPVFENSSHAELFDLTAAGTGWQISLKQDAVLNGEERIIVCFNHDGEDYRDERIWVSDASGLAMAWRSNGQPSINTFKTRESTKGSSDILFILYNGAVVTDLNDLVYDKTKLKITSQDNIPGFYNIEPLDWGTYIISHKDDANAKLTILCDLPAYGFYTTTQPDTETYVEDFTFTGNNHLYLAARNDAPSITSVQFEVGNNVYADESPYFLLTKVEDGVYEVTIKPDVELPGDNWYEFRVNNKNGWDAFSIGISDSRGLALGSARWNNGTYTPNSDRFKSETMSKGDSRILYLYCNGEMITGLTGLSWTDNLSVEIEKGGSRAYRVGAIGWGEGTITYTDSDNTAYTVKIDVQLPNYAFYTTPEASETAFVENNFTFVGNNHLYLVARNGAPAITSVQFEVGNNVYADESPYFLLTKIKDGVYEVTIKPDAELPGDDWYEFRVNNENGRRSVSIGISDASGLTMAYCGWDDDNNAFMLDGRMKSDSMTKGDWGNYFFLFNNEIITDLSQLSWSENLQMGLGDQGAQAFRVVAADWGEGVISYTDDADVTHTVTIHVQLPEYAFYSGPVATEDTMVEDLFVFDGEDNHLYLLPRDDDARPIVDIKLLNENSDEIAQHEWVTIDENRDGLWEVTLKDPAAYFTDGRLRVDVCMDGDRIHLGIDIANACPAEGLTYREVWEDENGQVEYGVRGNHLVIDHDYSVGLVFYFNGEPLGHDDLKNITVPLWVNVHIDNNPPVGQKVWVEGIDWNTSGQPGQIVYNYMDTPYVITVDVPLPEFAFYTTPTVTEPIETRLLWTAEDEAAGQKVLYALFREPVDLDPAELNVWTHVYHTGGGSVTYEAIIREGKLAGYSLTHTGCVNETAVGLQVRRGNEVLYAATFSTTHYDPVRYNDIPVEFYLNVDQDGKPVGDPIERFYQGNAPEDRTFYIFSDHFTADSILSVWDTENYQFEKLQSKAGVYYFRVVASPLASYHNDKHLEIRFAENAADEDLQYFYLRQEPTWDDGLLEFTKDGKLYRFGVLWDDPEKHEMSDSIGHIIRTDSNTVMQRELAFASITRDEYNDIDTIKRDPDLTSSMKIRSIDLYSYVNGVWTALGEGDSNLGKLQVLQGEDAYNGDPTLLIRAPIKEGAKTSFYLLQMSFTLEGDDTVYNRSIPVCLEEYEEPESLIIDLNDPDTMERWIGRDQKFDVTDLQRIFLYVQDPPEDFQEGGCILELPNNCVLEGDLSIQLGNVELTILGNGATLKGKVYIGRPSAGDSNRRVRFQNMNFVSYYEGVTDPNDVGVSGPGDGRFDRCTFRGYTIGVRVYEQEGSLVSTRYIDTCTFYECGTAIMLDRTHFAGGLRFIELHQTSFYENDIAIHVKSIEPGVADMSSLFFARECVFVQNRVALRNDTDYYIRFIHCYFGRYKDGIEYKPGQALGYVNQNDLDHSEPSNSMITGNGGILCAPWAASYYSFGDDFYAANRDDLVVGGKKVDMDNEAKDTFDVTGFSGKLDMQQATGVDYDHIATWDFSKEDDK